jgi:hypothetical protein
VTGTHWFASIEFRESALQTSGIKLVDRKNSDAALCASGAADQPLAATARGVGEGGVDNLNQLAIFRGWKGIPHHDT